MKRRDFLQAASVVVRVALAGGDEAGMRDPVEAMTAGAGPTIAISHVGFRPDSKKRVIVRLREAQSFELEDIGSGPSYKHKFVLSPVKSDLEGTRVGDFSEVRREGLYQIRVEDELSPPFFIRPDAWRRHLPVVVSYHKAQRCGVAVPNVHPACHLDDARRRDNGQHVDETGGWHDAGDLRKWMDATMMNAFGLLAIARNLGAKWDAAGSGLAPIEEEFRWGNRYFLKMQDADGRVFADVGGGLNGDNSDNHWTDNITGTEDDRYLNPAKGGSVQGMFTALQAMAAGHFKADRAYGDICLAAAKSCWGANQHAGETGELAWWTLAAVELFRATREEEFAAAARRLARELSALQRREGYWPMSKDWAEPYKDPVHGALPAFALLEAARLLPDGDDWRNAVKLHLEKHVTPLVARSAYGVMPYGVFKGTPTPEFYRPLHGELTYRFFMPCRKISWWLGLNAHVGSHALMLATAARDLQESRWRDMAYQQLEWVFGTNPFCASMTSGIGVRNPYPHSRYVGVIAGGIMNGICGNTKDEPVLEMGYSGNWRTNEYWSPQVGYFEWAQSVLELD